MVANLRRPVRLPSFIASVRECALPEKVYSDCVVETKLHMISLIERKPTKLSFNTL